MKAFSEKEVNREKETISNYHHIRNISIYLYSHLLYKVIIPILRENNTAY